VYKLFKALYELKQVLWAWYDRPKMFLLQHEYVMKSVDKTPFTLKHATDFLLVQIYVDDIIFGGSSHTLMSRFHQIIDNKFQMSMIGELTFFLGIQVKQTKQGIFIHQAKYTKDLMNKFNMAELKPISTPMSTTMTLDQDKNGEVVDQRVQEHDRLPPVPHGNTVGHSIHCVPLCMLSDFLTLFTSDDSSTKLQVP
jgi:hypothetical protein